MDKQRFDTVLRILLLFLFFSLIMYAYLKYGQQIAAIIKNPESLQEFFKNLGSWSIPAFILLQILQVVIAPLPGELVQFGAGYVFGTWLGTFVSLVGIFIGSVIAFFIARALGYPLLKNYIDPDRLKKWQGLLQSNRAEWIIFLIFLIPGLPKDIITFAAGISPIPWYTFFLLSMLGRFPGILVSSIIGANVYEGNYWQASIITVIITILFFVAVLYRKQILTYLKQHSRHTKKKK